LSGGQRQRLGLARAFFGNPQLVVLDEPNASLDAEGEESLRKAIMQMRDRGSTIVIIAQRLGILSLSDKILILDNGMMNAFGKRRDIAEKIRSGHTVIPVRNPQITARKPTRPSVEINSSEPSQSMPSKDATVDDEPQRAAS
jgi:ABC-type protease/lipase transport system fused ATPase/permease subunit